MSFVAGLQYTATKFQLLRALTMPKQEKLLTRLLKIPPLKDLTWNELEPCLVALGVASRPTAGDGSHGRFVSVKPQPCFSAPAIRIPCLLYTYPSPRDA